MNTKTVFKFDFVTDQDEEANKDEGFDDRILNSRLCPQQVDKLDYILNKKLDEQVTVNLNYQLKQQLNQRIHPVFSKQFNEQLTERLNSLNQEAENQKLIQKIKTTVHRSSLDQSKLLNLFFDGFNYYKSSLTKLNSNLIFLANSLLCWMQFLFTDIFHRFIFKFLLTNNFQRSILVDWLKKVTKNDKFLQIDYSPSDSVNSDDVVAKIDRLKEASFIELFSSGKLLCGLINELNANACPRFDLLDSDDVDTNLELAYRLILTHYGLDEKINLIHLNANEAERKLIDLISKIRYLEVKRALCSKYKIKNNRINRGNSLVQDNYLIRGMGLFAAVKNRVTFFNIFYYKFVDIVVEIVGPDDSYGCKRIKVDNFKINKPSRRYFLERNDSDERCEPASIEPGDTQSSAACKLSDSSRMSVNQKKRIPLKFIVKKQLIEISYLPIRAGLHTISIVHQGANILQSPYVLKVDDCN